jgi:xanthine dehydrogenase iron-sulfur cluster and FAD-binding subunit A
MRTSAVSAHPVRLCRRDAAVREAMAGNICRCGAYKNITAAIQQARTAGPANNLASNEPMSAFVADQMHAIRTGSIG